MHWTGLEEFAEGEGELAIAVVAEGWREGNDAERCLGEDSEENVLARDGGLIGGTHLAGFVARADVDALAERCGQTRDTPQEDRREHKVVGAAILVDRAGRKAQRTAQGEAEGLSDVAIEHGAGFEREHDDVLVDAMRDAGLGGELRSIRALRGVEEIASLGGKMHSELGTSASWVS